MKKISDKNQKVREIMKIGYLGTGAWGTALAVTLIDNGHEVIAWDRDLELLNLLEKNHRHPHLLDFVVSDKIKYVKTIEEVLTSDIDVIIESVTSSGIRPVFKQIKEIRKNNLVPIIITSKGIEQKTQMLFPEIAEEIFGKENNNLIGCVSGPSYADEVIKKMPTTVIGASTDPDLIQFISKIFNGEYFHVYPNDDILGVAFGGAMKNVITIACAISDGLGFGVNTKAALMTLGLDEMKRLCGAKGCNPETLNGLAGLGDLFLTCTSTLSRNYRFGRLIAKGLDIDEAKREIDMAVEGLYSCISAYELAKKNKIITPIIETVNAILYDKSLPEKAIRVLFKKIITEEG